MIGLNCTEWPLKSTTIHERTKTDTVITVCFNLSSLSLFLPHCGAAELIGNKCPFFEIGHATAERGRMFTWPSSEHSQVPLAHITLRYSCHRALASGAERERLKRDVRLREMRETKALKTWEKYVRNASPS